MKTKKILLQENENENDNNTIINSIKKDFYMKKHNIKTRIEKISWLNGKGFFVVTYYLRNEKAFNLDIYKEDNNGNNLGYVDDCKEVFDFKN